MFIIGFLTTDGRVQPLCLSKVKLSNRRLKSTVSKFKNDRDFVKPYQSDWISMYSSKRDAKMELPMINA